MQAISYLINAIFDLIVLTLILRIWLQLVRADFYNPLSQFIVRVTTPLVTVPRRFIPSIKGFDTATLVVALMACIIKFSLMTVVIGADFNIIEIIIFSMLSIVKQTGVLLFFIMIVMAIMSFVVQGYNPTMALFSQLTDPILKPVRSIIPPIGGLDLSILFVFIVLNVTNILLSEMIPYWVSI